MWGDGSSDTLGGDATSAAHTYSNAGNYSVVATASDDDPSSLDAAVSVSVADAAVSATGNSDLAGVVGSPLTDTLATISDANPDEDGSHLSAMIYWSDGAADAGVITSNGAGGFDVTDPRSFTSSGSISARIDVTDVGIDVSVNTFGNIAVAPFSVGSNSISVQEGNSFTGCVGTITDSNPNSTADNFSAAFTIGGSVYAVSIDGTGGNYSLNVSGVGPFVVSDNGSAGTLSVTEADTTQTAGNSLSVGDAPLSITPLGSWAMVGQNWSDTLAFATDSYPGETGSDLSATVSWTDETDAAEIDPLGGGVFVVRDSRVFNTAGVVHATVTVNDAGTSASTNISFSVQDATSLGVNGFIVQEGQTYSGSIGSINSPAPFDSPSNYFATLTLNGQTYPVDVDMGLGLDVTSVGPFTLADNGALGTITINNAPTGPMTANFSLSVTDAPISASGNPWLPSAVAGQSFTANFATFNDPDLAETASNYTVTIDYGDGTAISSNDPASANYDPSVSLASDNAGNWTVSAAHTFDTATTSYPNVATITITDAGGASASATSTIGVNAGLPSDLSVHSAGVHEVDLAWDNHSFDGVIYVSRSPSVVGPYSPIAALGGDPQSYRDTSVSDDTDYYYVVGPAPGLNADHTNIVLATTPIAAPSGLTDTLSSYASFTYVQFNWSNNSASADDFQLQRKDPGASDFAVIVPHTYGTSVYDSGLIDGATYQYRVVAEDDAGNLSAPSNVVTVTPPPLAPTGLVASAVSTSEIDLSWTNNATISTGVEIDRSTDESTFTPITASLAPDAVEFHDTGLISGTYYYYQVCALGSGDPSPFTNIPAYDVTPAIASSFTAAGISTSEVDLTWALNISDVTALQLSRSSDGVNFTPLDTPTLGPAYTQYSDITAAPGTSYWYQLKVTEDSGAVSIAGGAFGYTLPVAPASVTAAPGSSGSVNVSWVNDDPDAYLFRIECSDGGNFTLGDGFSSGSFGVGQTIIYTDAAPDDTPLTYRVETVDFYNEESDLSADSNTVTTPLLAPSDLSATALSSSQIALTWANNSTAATGIELDRSTDGVHYTTLQSFSDLTTRQYVDSGLDESAHYWYRVRATAPGTTYPTSDYATADTITEVAAESLSATAVSMGEIDLSWILNTVGATGIEVDRSTDGVNFTTLSPTLPPTASSYSDAGLTENTSYTYTVRVLNGASSSAFTDPAEASTFAAITDVSATASSIQQIDLSWTLNLDPATVTSIEIDRSSSADGPFDPVTSVDPATTTYSDAGLSESTDYFYQIHAITTSGDAEEITATDATTFATVDSLSADAVSTSEIDLSWNLNCDDAVAIWVERSWYNGGSYEIISTLAGDATSYNDASLQDNSTYTYRIGASRPNGMSYSDPANASTMPVLNLTATTVSTSEIDLTWAPNIDPSLITSIEIERSDNNGLSWYPIARALDPSATIFKDTALTEDQTYLYRFTATPATGAFNPVTSAACSTAAIQDLTNTPGATSETLTWSNFATSATGIEVYRSDNGGTFNLRTTLTDPTATTFTDTGLTPNTSYAYELRAVDGVAAMTAPLDTLTLPNAPTNVIITSATPTQVNLSWTGSGSSTTAYYIERSDDGGATFSIIDVTDPGATTYSDSSVTDGASVMYRVDALSGDSIHYSSSDATSALTVPLAAPTRLQATANGQTEIDLSWTNNSQDATGYVIGRSTDGINFTLAGTVDTVDEPFFSDTGLMAGTRYYYRVLAVGTDASRPSNIANAPTDASIDVTLTGQYEAQTWSLIPLVHCADGTPNPAASGWTVNWGDGMSSTSGSPTDPIDHVYAISGDYTLVAATGDDSFSKTIAVRVLPTGQTLTLTDNTEDGSIVAGTTYQLTAHATGGHLLRWFIDWGDTNTQTIDATSTSPNQTDYTATFTHDYAIVYCGVQVHISAEFADSVRAAHTAFYILFLEGTGGYFIGRLGIGLANGVTGFNTFTRGTEGTLGVWDYDAQYYTNFDWTLDWGDGSSSDFTGPMVVNFTHTYTVPGVYDVRATNDDMVNGPPGQHDGTSVYVSDHTEFAMTTPPAQVVGVGDPVDISVPYTGKSPFDNRIAYIRWGDITIPMTVSGGYSGTLSAHFDHAPGTPDAPEVFTYDADNSDYDPHWVGIGQPGTGFAVPVYVVSLTIGGVTSGSGNPTNGILCDDSISANGTPETDLPVPDATDPNLVPGSLDLSPSAPGTSELTFPSSIRVFAYVNETLTQIASGTVITTPGFSFWIQGITAAANLAMQGTITVTGVGAATTQATTNVVSGTIGIVESDGTELPHAQNMTSGGYVLLNDGDANYEYSMEAGGPATPNGLIPIPDNSPKKTKIDGENRLVPIHIHAFSDPTPGGYYQLRTNSKYIRLWMNANKSDSITPQTQLNEAGTTVYVEGFALSSGKAQDTVTLKFIAAPGAKPMVMDQAAFTVYSVEGPANVISDDAYTYVATVPGDPVSPQWTGDGATILSGATDTSARALWYDGGSVSRLYYSPAPGFRGEFDANVVGVSLTQAFADIVPDAAATSTRAKTLGTQAGLLMGTAPGKIRWGNALELNAPMIRGIARGLRFLQFGYMQDFKVDDWNAKYADGTSLRSSMQGTDYDDPTTNPNIPGRPAVGNWPWVNTTDAGDKGGYWDRIREEGESGIRKHQFEGTDRPKLGVPVVNRTNSPLVSSVIKASVTDVLAVNILGQNFNRESSYAKIAQFGWFCDYSYDATMKLYTAAEAIVVNSWRYDVSGQSAAVPPLPGFNTVALNVTFI